MTQRTSDLIELVVLGHDSAGLYHVAQPDARAMSFSKSARGNIHAAE